MLKLIQNSQEKFKFSDFYVWGDWNSSTFGRIKAFSAGQIAFSEFKFVFFKNFYLGKHTRIFESSFTSVTSQPFEL